MKKNKLFFIFSICLFIFSLSSCTKIGSCKCHGENALGDIDHVISKEEVDVSTCSELEKQLNENGMFTWDCSFTL